jgi:hypothetical protein
MDKQNDKVSENSNIDNQVTDNKVFNEDFYNQYLNIAKIYFEKGYYCDLFQIIFPFYLKKTFKKQSF